MAQFILSFMSHNISYLWKAELCLSPRTELYTKDNAVLFCLLTRSSNPTAPWTHNQNFKENVSIYFVCVSVCVCCKDLAKT